MIKKFSKPFIGFLQATGLVVYLMLISAFFNFLPTFVQQQDNMFFAPILMLLLFIISAVISGSLVLGNAGVLFWEKKYKESFTLIAWTLGWGIAYLVAVVLLLAK